MRNEVITGCGFYQSQKYEVVMSVILPLPKVRGFKNEMCLIVFSSLNQLRAVYF